MQYSKEFLLEIHKNLLEARLLEEKMKDLYAQGRVPGHVHSGVGQGPGSHRVSGLDHRHIGKGAHNSHILNRGVGGPVAAHLQAGMGADDGNIQVGVAHEGAHLLAGPHRGEHRKGGQKHLVAAGGQAGGGSHQILLRNSEGKFPLREQLAEFFQAAGLGVGVAHDKIGVGFGNFNQLLPKGHSGRNGSHYTTPPS